MPKETILKHWCYWNFHRSVIAGINGNYLLFIARKQWKKYFCANFSILDYNVRYSLVFCRLESWCQFWFCNNFVVTRYKALNHRVHTWTVLFKNGIFQQWRIFTVNPLAFFLSLHLTLPFFRGNNIGLTSERNVIWLFIKKIPKWMQLMYFHCFYYKKIRAFFFYSNNQILLSSLEADRAWNLAVGRSGSGHWYTDLLKLSLV